MKKFGNKPMTGEQVRWGFENLDLTAARIKELGFEGMVEPDQAVLPGPPGRRRRPRPAVGRQGVEGDLRLLQGRPVDPRPDGQGAVGQVRGGEEDHAARLLQGELSAVHSDRAAARSGAARLFCSIGRRSDARWHTCRTSAANADRDRSDDRIPLGEQHRGGLLLTSSWCSRASRSSVPKGGIVALLGANGAGKTTTLKAISNLLHAERGEVTKGSIDVRRRAGASAVAQRSGAARLHPGDGGPPLLRPSHRRGESAHRRLHPARRQGRGRAPTSSWSIRISRASRSAANPPPATPPAASSRCARSAAR